MSGRRRPGSLLLGCWISEDALDLLTIDEERTSGAGVYAEDFASRRGVGFSYLQPTLVAGLNLKLATLGFAINRGAVEQSEMNLSLTIGNNNGLLGVRSAVTADAILEIKDNLDGADECGDRLAGFTLNHL